MTRTVYKNNFVQEAVCVFFFAPQGLWTPVIGGDFYKEIQDIQDGAPRQEVLPDSFGRLAIRTVFPNSDGSHLVLVGPDYISLNIVEEYSGWEEQFRPFIDLIVGKFLSVRNEPPCVKIALRFINAFPEVKAIGNAFRFGEVATSHIPGSRMEIFNRAIINLEEGVNVILQHGDSSANGVPNQILDMDLTAAKDFETWDDAKRAVERWHTFLRDEVFEKLLATEFKEKLR